jgi:DNA-binding MarR family transcriptional regulator
MTDNTRKSAFYKRPPYQIVLLGQRLNKLNSQYYLAQFQLGVTEGRILGLLSARDEVAAADLCDTLDLDQGAVSRGVQKLINMQYVCPSTDGSDSRKKMLRLTAHGERSRADLIAAIWRRTEMVLTGFSAGERKLLEEFIERMLANIPLVQADVNAEAVL